MKNTSRRLYHDVVIVPVTDTQQIRAHATRSTCQKEIIHTLKSQINWVTSSYRNVHLMIRSFCRILAFEPFTDAIDAGQWCGNAFCFLNFPQGRTVRDLLQNILYCDRCDLL